MGEISEFQYAYFNCEAALVRIKIPTTLDRSCKHDFELVFFNPSHPLPQYRGLFSHRHIVYIVGGHEGHKEGGYMYEYSDDMHMFDPTKFHQFPAEDIPRLDNPKFAPMVAPSVIRAENRIYFLSLSDYFCEGLDVDGPLLFQSFDPIQNLFETLPPPPLSTVRKVNIDGHFFLSGYIYVFISETSSCYCDTIHTFKFDTISSKWEDSKSLVDRFKEKNIPFLFSHCGDIGLSDEFSDNTRILVALCGAQPTAYHVHLHAGGDIEPISHRELGECYIRDYDRLYSICDDWKQLADMGGGRFCVMRGTSTEDFLIYVFEIDFALEHNIQTSDSGSGAVNSSHIIFSKKFNLDTVPEKFSFTSCCIAFAPPASPNNEDQDKNDRKMKNTISCKKGSSGNKGMHKSKNRSS